MWPTITYARTEPDYRLRLAYADGTTALVDFAPLIAQGGVFAPLADPAFFSQVRIGARGRSVEWPGDLDFCADAFWQDAVAVGQGAKALVAQEV